jgi:hypothetical protein
VPTGSNGATHPFVGERQELGRIATTASDDDNIGIGKPARLLDARHDGIGSRHQHFDEVQRESREASGCDRLNVVLHGGVGTAHHDDAARDHGKWPPGAIDQAFGSKPVTGLRDQRGDRAVADGDDFRGNEADLSSAGIGDDLSGDRNPFAVDDPSAPDAGSP